MKLLVHNLIFLSGSALVFYGLWMVYPPVAYIVTGVYVVVLAIMAAPVKGK